MKPKAKKKVKSKLATRLPGPRKLKPQYIGKRVPEPYVALPQRTVEGSQHFSQTVKDEVIRRISGGETLLGICREENYPDARTVQWWVLKDPDYRERYNQAVKMRCEVWAEQLKEKGENPLVRAKVTETLGGKDGPVTKTETYDAVDRARLDSDNTKWLLARLDPNRYGDKLTTENTTNANINMRVQVVEVVIVDPVKRINASR